LGGREREREREGGGGGEGGEERRENKVGLGARHREINRGLR